MQLEQADWSFNMANGAPQNRGQMNKGQITVDKTFDERVVYVNRVARVVRGGSRFRFSALVVVGDHKGRVGTGVSKGADVSAAVTKATEVAKKHLLKIPMHNNSLTHEVEGRIGGSKIVVMPAAPGTGLIAGGVVRTVLEVAGIENALSKSLGSANRVNTAYAALEALESMVPAKNWTTVTHPAKHSKKPVAKAPAENK